MVKPTTRNCVAQYLASLSLENRRIKFSVITVLDGVTAQIVRPLISTLSPLPLVLLIATKLFWCLKSSQVSTGWSLNKSGGPTIHQGLFIVLSKIQTLHWRNTSDPQVQTETYTENTVDVSKLNLQFHRDCYRRGVNNQKSDRERKQDTFKKWITSQNTLRKTQEH